MTTSTIASYLQYANLQMAAEAFLIDPDTKLLLTNASKLTDALKAGNGHA